MITSNLKFHAVLCAIQVGPVPHSAQFRQLTIYGRSVKCTSIVTPRTDSLHSSSTLLQTNPDTRRDAYRIVAEFAHHGLRKTSMVGLAKALGVSRQTLYNWFDSKEAALAWAVETSLADLHASARACLTDPHQDTTLAINEALCSWLCPITSLLHSGAHGADFLGFGFNRQQAATETLDEFTTELGQFLHKRSVCADAADACELAFLLVMAAKGLLFTCTTEEDFRTGIARAISGAGLNSTSNLTQPHGASATPRRP